MSALDDAREISGRLDAIRKLVREAVQAQAANQTVPLTAPQVHAVEILVDEMRSSGTGVSLSELSRRMGLAHSTVSGIVTRLEGRGLLRRVAHPDDRRVVSIEVTDAVKGWLERELPAARLAPVADALRRASKKERAAVVDGLATLERLLREHRARHDQQ
jgi:DNA-binding MarR family transcriptional regulator